MNTTLHGLHAQTIGYFLGPRRDAALSRTAATRVSMEGRLHATVESGWSQGESSHSRLDVGGSGLGGINDSFPGLFSSPVHVIP